jgi:type I restriction enzyme S subunit
MLAKAFRAELVAQDPGDEPASVLLERIRAEREASGINAPRGRAGTSRRAPIKRVTRKAKE